MRSRDWLIVVTERYQQFADYRLFLASLARLGPRTPLVTGIHHGVWWLAMAGQLQGIAWRELGDVPAVRRAVRAHDRHAADLRDRPRSRDLRGRAGDARLHAGDDRS
jgi:hypothetical protein